MKIDRINNRPMNKETYALRTTVINLIELELVLKLQTIKMF